MATFLLPRRSPHALPDEQDLIQNWSASGGENDIAVVSEWEQAVGANVSMPHAAAVSSGRMGMTYILEHLGIGDGDEVIVPAFTLKDLLPLIQRLGATVVPADVDRDTLNVTADSIAARVTPRTRAAIVLHAFGAPAPMTRILEVTAPKNIPVIEDAAHALGATLDGRPIGSFGYAAFFSFETTKPINTYGGGMVVSRDETLVAAIHEQEARKPVDASVMMNRFSATRREHMLMNTGLALPPLALLAVPLTKPLMNAAYRGAQQLAPPSVRYSPIQARLGLAKLAGLNERIAHRRALVARYTEELPAQVRVQRLETNATSTWYFCVAVLLTAAGPVRRRMLLRGVDAGIEDEISDNCAALLGFKDCPNINTVFQKLIALPIFDSCTEQQAVRAARALKRCLSVTV